MASRLQIKRSFDVAADNNSLESLSFSDLVCIQEQKLGSPPTNGHRVREQDRDFAFCQTMQDPAATGLIKYTPADLLISDGKLIPQTFVCQPKHQKRNQPHRKGPLPATSTASKRLGDKTGAKEVSDKRKLERNQVQDENNTSRSGFGWKLFKSFASPCRECKAAKPTVLPQTVQRESLKIY